MSGKTRASLGQRYIVNGSSALAVERTLKKAHPGFHVAVMSVDGVRSGLVVLYETITANARSTGRGHQRLAFFRRVAHHPPAKTEGWCRASDIILE